MREREPKGDIAAVVPHLPLLSGVLLYVLRLRVHSCVQECMRLSIYLTLLLHIRCEN